MLALLHRVANPAMRVRPFLVTTANADDVAQPDAPTSQSATLPISVLVLSVPKTVLTVVDLLLRRPSEPGMIRRWR